jgi:signal transduction histidine kinase
VTVGWNHEAGAAMAGAPATTGVWSCIEVEDTGIGIAADQQQAQLARLRASGRHLLGLVDEILDLAKIEAGQLAVSRSMVRVADTVEAALALVRPQADARRIALSTRPGSPADTAFVGDPQRAQQVLINLLSNAVKFTEPGGSVTVGWRREEGASTTGAAATAPIGSWIDVVVTGIGIAADQQQAIFEAFMQADQGRTRTRGGTGLGLAISRHLARLMSGELSVRSQLGEGSCFTLRLPAARDVAAGEPAHGVSTPSASAPATPA